MATTKIFLNTECKNRKKILYENCREFTLYRMSAHAYFNAIKFCLQTPIGVKISLTYSKRNILFPSTKHVNVTHTK